MRTAGTSPAILLVLFLSAGAVLAGGDVNLLVGQKSSDEGLFADVEVDDQDLIGLAVNVDVNQPFVLAVDLLVSSADSSLAIPSQSATTVGTDVETFELDVGARKTFGARLVPYVGAGVSWARLDVQQTVTDSLGPGSEFTDTILDDSDSALGFWAGAGLLYRIGGRFNLGVDLRYTSAKPRLSPVGESISTEFEAGGGHYSLVLGYHW